jgi:phosphocarrier protein HPr
MVSARVTVVNALGLHARAAARFVHLASSFQSKITVSRGSRTVDGKSILGLLLLAAGRGRDIDLVVEGPDEQDALSALMALTARGFEDPALA